MDGGNWLMEGMTAITEPTMLNKRIERLQKHFRAAIAHFRNGEETQGMEDFLSGVEELDRAVEIDQHSNQQKIDLEQLLPAVRELYFCMQNQDVIEIADLLEYTVIPLTREWLLTRG
jgi:hypothetical protein